MGCSPRPSRSRSSCSPFKDCCRRKGLTILQRQLATLASQERIKRSVWDSSWPLRWRYGARKGIVALIAATNVAYDEDKGRGFFKQLLISLAFTLGMVSELRSIRCLFPCT